MVEPLFDDFFNYTKSISVNSRPSYRTYLVNNVINSLSVPSVIDNNYIDIVAFSIASGNKIIALDIIDNLLKALPKGKAYSALNVFRSFINSPICDEKMAQKSLSECGISGKNSSDFRNGKIKNSLRNQSRISGNKTWLPLAFLADLSSFYKFNFFNIWINNLYNKIHIILKDISTPSSVQHVLLSKIDYIGICRTGVVVALFNGMWYQVLTPNGYLNHKEDMMIDGDFSKISIDHVKPIDRTLSLLPLPALDIISKFVQGFKELHNLRGKQLEHAAFKEFCKLATQKGNVLHVKSLPGSSFKKGGRIDINQLKSDLYDILKDSHYRLMSSSINSNKSNFLNYECFYHDAIKNKYYGYIGDCKINSTTDGIIYQDLDTNYVSVIDVIRWNMLSHSPIKDVNVPIDKL